MDVFLKVYQTPKHCTQFRIQRLLSKSHTFSFYFQYVLQLPLQNTHCCMQYAYSQDILLHHNIVPWSLTLLLIQAAQKIVGHSSQKSMLACILQSATGCSRTSWYFWHTALDILCNGTYQILLVSYQYGSMDIGTHPQKQEIRHSRQVIHQERALACI